jgi:2-polyprenyl-3-methyl-5-hydroxy-6-metoxy-1,4-benzoquinol methylase
VKAGPFPSAASSGAPNVKIAENRGRRIGILVVAYNAVGTLVQVLRRIPDVVWENIEEVAIFDDASHDATYELAVGYKTLAEHYKLHVVRNDANLGYGGNQKLGYKYFMNKGFDVVVLLHGDGQYAPEILHHLYHPIVAGEADAVLGSRMMPDFDGPLKGGMPLYKYVGNRILSSLENRALGLNLTEFHSGYRAYDLHALEKIDMSAMTDDFHFDTEIIIKLHHQRFRIKEVPIPTYYGKEICYVNGMKYAFDVVRALRRYRSTVRSARRFPEFAEYFVRYNVKESRGSSHDIASSLVGPNQDVLDVGCGEGLFASVLTRHANAVAGIDIIPVPRHREAFDEYVCADLSEGLAKAANGLRKRSFDRILMMDVLQQLPYPEAPLRDAKALLKPNGLVVVSVPNVANLSVRAGLAFGNFEYGDRGILDRAHLRFFTRKSLRALLDQCGYDIVSERASTVPLEFVLDVPPENAMMKAFNGVLRLLTRIFPRLLGYQWVVAARPRIQTPATP